jgi:hypothetical protein
MSLSRRLLLALVGLLVLGLGGWSVLALLLSPILPPPMRLAAALGMAAVLLAALAGLGIRRLRPALLLYSLAVVLVAVGWMGLSPTNDADWIPEVARAPTASVDGDQVTVHNVRNFAWRTETEFEQHWEDRHYDLSQLERLDFFASFWAGENIAHTILSFGFKDGSQLAASIEIRRREGQEFSPVAGFFRNYELVYVLADERDVIRLRTNVRHERVFLYRLRTPPEAVRRLFLEYLHDANVLAERPAFYNTLTANCTTLIRVNAIAAGGTVPWSWKMLLSGHSPEFLYNQGMVDTRLPFDELRRRSSINRAAQAADADPQFSQRIRAGLPDPLR